MLSLHGARNPRIFGSAARGDFRPSSDIWHLTTSDERRSGYTCPVGDRPYFAWDVNVTEAELRDKLRCSDADARAQWQGWIMAEARYPDVWRFLSLDEILRDWSHIRLHLGRKRAFWEFLLDGWRSQGLIRA